MNKLLLIACAGVALMTTAGLEARGYFGMSFGGGMVERRVATPVYVEEHYYEDYGCCHAPVACRRVYTYPVYQERVYVQPRPMFSFGFFR